jgi:hypothetical protein
MALQADVWHLVLWRCAGLQLGPLYVWFSHAQLLALVALACHASLVCAEDYPRVVWWNGGVSAGVLGSLG